MNSTPPEHNPAATVQAVNGQVIEQMRQYGYTPTPAPIAHALRWNGSLTQAATIITIVASLGGAAQYIAARAGHHLRRTSDDLNAFIAITYPDGSDTRMSVGDIFKPESDGWSVIFATPTAEPASEQTAPLGVAEWADYVEQMFPHLLDADASIATRGGYSAMKFFARYLGEVLPPAGEKEEVMQGLVDVIAKALELMARADRSQANH